MNTSIGQIDMSRINRNPLTGMQLPSDGHKQLAPRAGVFCHHPQQKRYEQDEG